MRRFPRRFVFHAVLSVLAAVLTLSAPPVATTSAFDGTYRRVEAGDLSFDVPSAMRAPSVDDGGPGRVDSRAPDWTYTVTDRPERPDEGMTITLQWSRDAADSSSGDQILSSGRESASGFSADQTTWRSDSMGWRGMDFVLRDAAPNGEPLRISCHAPESKWPTIERICRHVASSVVVATTDAAGPTASPSPSPDDGSRSTASPSSTSSPSSSSTSTSPEGGGGGIVLLVAVTAVSVIVAIVLTLLLSWRRSRVRRALSATAIASPPAAPPAHPPASRSVAPSAPRMRAAPCFCTECGARITLIGPCPACGAAVEGEDG